jgi:CubicO group peptidase (beta-lactamase class C family)
MKSHPRYPLLLALFVAALPIALAPAGDAPSSSGIKSALQPYVDRHEIAGAVTLVADRDKVLSLDAVGFADVEAKTPMIVQALFWIASQSKPITAVLLMMLVDEGKVNLDDAVEKYLPEFKGQKLIGPKGDLEVPNHPITVREILTHTSGLPFSTKKETPTLDTLTLAEAARSYGETPLQSEPGTRFAYSNAGINTAGRIIEVVSGMPFEDFLAKRLTAPLGMKDTTFWPSEEQLKRLAKSYRPTKDKNDLEEVKIGQLKYPLNDRKRQPMPAGGLFSTASDVGRFCQMVANGGTIGDKQYLTEAAVKEMTKRQTGPNIKEDWGLGWSRGGNGFGHGGAHATNMWIDAQRGLITVWMVQETGGFPGKGGEAQGAFNKAASGLIQGPAKAGSAPPKGLRVFSCGHSFHFFMPPILTDIAKGAGITDHQFAGLSSIGGSRVIQHWNVPDEKNKAKEKLRAGAVDVLTLAPIYLPDDGIEKFVDLAVDKNPNVRVTLQEFWLPYDVYDTKNPLKGRKVDHNAATLAELRKEHEPYFASIDEQVRALNKKIGKEKVFVVPVGQAVLALRAKIIAGEAPGLKSQDDLFTDAIGHVRAPVQALNAYCHYAVIYRQSPVGLPVPAVLSKAADAEKLNRLLQELAWDAVTHHPLSGVKNAAPPQKSAGIIHRGERGDRRVEQACPLCVSCELCSASKA